MPLFALEARQQAHTHLVGTLAQIAKKREAIAALSPPTMLVAIIEGGDEPARLERIEAAPETIRAIVGAPTDEQLRLYPIGVSGARAFVWSEAVYKAQPSTRRNFQLGGLLYGTLLILADDGRSDLTRNQIDALDLNYGPLVGRALLSY